MENSLYPDPIISIVYYPTIPPKEDIVISKRVINLIGANKVKMIIKIASTINQFENIGTLKMAPIINYEKEILWLVINKIDNNIIKTIILTSEI